MSAKPPRLSEIQEAAVRARFCAAIESRRPELAAAGRQVLDRVSPPNWTLEWSLPGWLGDALHLPAGPTADLTLANVVGLAYVRLRDDLMDGEIPEGDRRTALMLATAFYRTWLLAYTDMFASGSPFWAFFEQYMAQWAGATLHDDPPAARRFSEYDDLDLRRLGRAAPRSRFARPAPVSWQGGANGSRSSKQRSTTS